MEFADIPMEEKQKALNELRGIKEQFASRGWFPGANGSLSVRVGDFKPNQFYCAVTSSGGQNDSAQASEDFLFVDVAGNPCEATRLQPCPETPIHAKIYRMCGCGAIFHVHTVFNHVLSERYGVQGFVPIQGTELIKGLGSLGGNAAIRIPVVPNDADISSIAKLIPGMLNPDVPGILLRNHGIYAWGKNAYEAKNRLESFEFMLEVEYRRLALERQS